MVSITQGLSVDLVLVFGARRASCEPGIFGHDLDTTNRCAIAWGFGEDLLDFLASDSVSGDVVRGESLEAGLLLAVGVGVDTGVIRLAEAVLQIGVMLGRGAASNSFNLTSEQGQQDAVLIRGPRLAVEIKERRSG